MNPLIKAKKIQKNKPNKEVNFISSENLFTTGVIVFIIYVEQ